MRGRCDFQAAKRGRRSDKLVHNEMYYKRQQWDKAVCCAILSEKHGISSRPLEVIVGENEEPITLLKCITWYKYRYLL